MNERLEAKELMLKLKRLGFMSYPEVIDLIHKGELSSSIGYIDINGKLCYGEAELGALLTKDDTIVLRQSDGTTDIAFSVIGYILFHKDKDLLLSTASKLGESRDDSAKSTQYMDRNTEFIHVWSPVYNLIKKLKRKE